MEEKTGMETETAIETKTKIETEAGMETGADAAREEPYTFAELVRIVAVLRGEHGCPWDRAQTYESMKKCLVDETEEVLQAVDNQDMDNLCEELGDVLLQVIMNSQIASERGDFTLEQVIDGLCRKMIRRHPHVFGQRQALSPEEGLALWNEMKRQEKAEKKKQKQSKSEVKTEQK